MKMRLWLLITILFGMFLVAGCGPKYGDMGLEAFDKPEKVLVTSDQYILMPPDEIQIHCSRVPEVDLQIHKIRPDGKILLEGVGELTAAGKTPAQLSKEIADRLSSMYTFGGQQPIGVQVFAYSSSWYYVVGQVLFEGPRLANGRETLLFALNDAKPTILAWTDKIRVIRPPVNENDLPEIFVVSYKQMTEHGDMSKNVLLQEGDIIYVPPTVLASIAMVVEEFVRPIARAFGTVNIVSGPPARNN